MVYMATNARNVGYMSQAVGAEMRAELARQRKSARSFAKEHRLPLSTLHKNLRGERAIDVEDIDAFCTAAGIQASELIARAENVLRNVPLAPVTQLRAVAPGQAADGEAASKPADPVSLADYAAHDADTGGDIDPDVM